MKTTIEISVVDVVGSDICVSSVDGEKVYQHILRYIENGNKVAISFYGYVFLSPAFLSSALGELYGKFTEEYLEDVIQITDMRDNDVQFLGSVLATCKQYFCNPESFNKAMEESENED